MKQKPIHLMITGGTIDSHYDGTRDTAVTNNESVLPGYFASLKLFRKIVTSSICMKDSRQITNKDRIKLIDAIKNSSAKNILITHGTYTMPDTARYLMKNLEGGGRQQNYHYYWFYDSTCWLFSIGCTV